MRPWLPVHWLIAALLLPACEPVDISGETPISRRGGKVTADEVAAPSPSSAEADRTPKLPGKQTPAAPTTTSTPEPAPAPPPGPAPPPPPAGPQRIRGSLAQTGTVPFGGGEHCNYRVTFRDVTVDIATDASGVPTSATVTGIAFEEVLSNPCTNAPIPEHRQQFTMTSQSERLDGSRRILLAPGPDNKPPADLVLDGDLTKASPVMTLSWHRIDFPAPLDWRIEATVTGTK